MPDPRRRRQGEDAYEDPSEQSMIKKLGKNQYVDAIVRAVLMVGLGGGAGWVSNEHKTTEDTKMSGELASLKVDYEEFRKRNRERNQERDAAVKSLQDRILTLEVKLEERRHAP